IAGEILVGAIDGKGNADIRRRMVALIDGIINALLLGECIAKHSRNKYCQKIFHSHIITFLQFNSRDSKILPVLPSLNSDLSQRYSPDRGDPSESLPNRKRRRCEILRSL